MLSKSLPGNDKRRKNQQQTKDKTNKDLKVFFIQVEIKLNKKKSESYDSVFLEEIFYATIQIICSVM